MQAFGAVPTMVTAPEGYQALERGTIDSFGFPYTFAFGAYNLCEVSKFVTEGLAMSGFMRWEGVSLTAWNKLPDDLKAKLPMAQAAAREALFKAFAKDDAKWLPIFKEKLEITQFPDAARNKLIAASEPIWQAWAKEQVSAGRPGAELLNFIKAEVAKAKSKPNN
ncbi:TRAP transporter substrate-binding protein [Reyranella sp.]|uniref:TRAP transporter substrate-binding protein n=1 Tax=Reyranella sp. TaxID=1929291 RepID=UPI003D0F8D29